MNVRSLSHAFEVLGLVLVLSTWGLAYVGLCPPNHVTRHQVARADV